MNVENRVIKLCIQGTQAEFRGDIRRARQLYRKAWEAHTDDYEACIAAHYVARHQDDPAEALRWNREALMHANLVSDERVKDFLPSLYLNIGRSYEAMGEAQEAERFYEMAVDLGALHEGEDERGASARDADTLMADG